MKCNYCKGFCIKKGKYKAAQKYQCKACKKYQRTAYYNRKYDTTTDLAITRLNNEGMSISSISRILHIPKTSIQRRIFITASKTITPIHHEVGQVYEVDELHTYVRKNHFPTQTYIMYAINRTTRKIIDFIVGARTKENIRRLINKLLTLSPKRIYTDQLNVFESLIPAKIHRNHQYKTNRIERKNLTLRTHLKRLSRKTICYSKSSAMLNACVRLYVFQ